MDITFQAVYQIDRPRLTIFLASSITIYAIFSDLREELERQNKLVPGVIVADFETKLKESEQLKKIMKREDATGIM